MQYIKSFDGVRGIGALMIILYHWPFKYFNISHGWEFMQMFFVMSGYLITANLLKEKQTNKFKPFAIKFYIKRSLRLFPLYYGYICFFWVFYLLFKHKHIVSEFLGEINQHLIYLLTYTYNYMLTINFFEGWSYKSGLFSTHLWTLSMEEQFYLVFPFLIFYLSKTSLKKLVIACIIIAFFFRIFIYFYFKQLNPNDVAWVAQNLVRLPFAQMDSFAFGAILALFNVDKIFKKPKQWFIYTTIVLVLVYALNMIYVYYIQGSSYYKITFGKRLAENWMTHNYLFVYLITLVNFWCMIILLCLSRGYNIKWLLENKLVLFVGKLSYGVYLFHLPLLVFFVWMLNKIKLLYFVRTNPLSELIALFVFMAMLLLIAYLVFTYYESFFLRLKNKLYKK